MPQFIIDTYNKYDAWDRAHSHYKFKIGEQWYAIKDAAVPTRVDTDANLSQYKIYLSIDDAISFVRQVKFYPLFPVSASLGSNDAEGGVGSEDDNWET